MDARTRRCINKNLVDFSVSKWTLTMFLLLLLLLDTILSIAEWNIPLNYPLPVTINAKTGTRGFSIYWNVPTFQCHKYGLTFDYLTESYGIEHNKNDDFRGDKLAILYDPGMFPALLKQKNSQQLFVRNNGVPQEGNLEEHLNVFKKQLVELIPDGRFSGKGIIDFESWRPIYRQNFGTLKPYQDYSYEIERKKKPFWPSNWIKDLATRRFEESAKSFMGETLKAAKETRPLAKWGFYAYPYCFNMNGNKRANCADNVVDENNRIQWLWDQSDALYPSVYMNKYKLNPAERLTMVKGRVFEAKRIASRTGWNPEIYPYIWYKYQDETEEFLDKADFENALNHMKNSKLNGAIIWGSSNDVNTKANCQRLDDYVKNTLGPLIKNVLFTNTQRIISNFTTYEEEILNNESILDDIDLELKIN